MSNEPINEAKYSHIDILSYICYNILMQSKLEKYLYLIESMGLKPMESEVYLALLQAREATVSQLHEVSKIQRTYIYDILHSLEEKAIVSCVEISGVKTYTPVSLLQLKKRQQNRIARFEEAIPEMLSLIGSSKNAPRVRFYEGQDGFIEAQNDTLALPKGGEILAYYTGQGFYASSPEIPKNYIKNRIAKNIKVRAIGADTPETKIWSENDKAQLRESRMVPAELFPCENEINIYGNKISILSLTDEMIAVVIESESIANTQRAIFELAWRGAKEFSN